MTLHYISTYFFYLEVRYYVALNIILAWSASLWFMVLNLAEFAQISIIFFYPLCVGLLLK